MGLEGVDDSLLQVALLQTAAGDGEIFIFSEPHGCEALQQQCTGVVEFECNVIPGHIALHAALLQYERNQELTRIRIDHGKPHSFTIERQGLPLLEHYANYVMVESELSRLEQTRHDEELLCNVEAVLDFDFHVLCRKEGQGGLLQVLPLAEVSGKEDHRLMAAAWTAPDLLGLFLAKCEPSQVREEMQMAQMKGTALFQLLQIDQTNSGVQGIAFNPALEEERTIDWSWIPDCNRARTMYFETRDIARIGQQGVAH